MQDLNYSVPAPNDNHKAAQQDILQYTYTLTFDVRNSTDTSWNNLVLTTGLQDNLHIRAINGKTSINGNPIDNDGGFGAINMHEIWGDLKASDADANGKITKTVTLDYELASTDGITFLDATQATIDGTGTSGGHSESTTNPKIPIDSGDRSMVLDFSSMQVYNDKQSADQVPESQTISGEETDKVKDGKHTGQNNYTLKSGDTNVVLNGGLWGSGNADDYDIYTVINGVKTETGAKPGSFGLIFTREGATADRVKAGGDPVYKASPLHTGINDIKIYALNTKTGRLVQGGSAMAPPGDGDTKKNPYPYVEFTIIDPTPTLVINHDVHFKDTQLTGDSSYVATKDDDSPFSMVVKYADADNWALSVQTTKFTDASSNALKGQLVYRTTDGTYLLNDSPNTIYSNDGTSGLEQSSGSEFDITSKWKHDDFAEDDFASGNPYGLYLNLFSDATASDTSSTSYTGQITWTFSNTPLASTTTSN
ncbi:hypothetical protein [Lacticaseibacillus songhuajiangensis]|uniref:hypothetical protein n=1 Tax=Lacticaseibacillus songhuajiangensis TaxID=1296539 RepID=UPI000F77165C|nr:hypothetical protein [Lacticaseibacillus songhuajiangensis]